MSCIFADFDARRKPLDKGTLLYRVFQNPAPPSRAQVSESWVKSMIVG